MRRINLVFFFMALAGVCILGCTAGDQSAAPARPEQPAQPAPAASAPASTAGGPEVMTDVWVVRTPPAVEQVIRAMPSFRGVPL